MFQRVCYRPMRNKWLNFLKELQFPSIPRFIDDIERLEDLFPVFIQKRIRHSLLVFPLKELSLLYTIAMSFTFLGLGGSWFWDYFKEVRGSFAILFWLPCATWHRVMTHTHHTQSFRSTDAFLRHSTPGAGPISEVSWVEAFFFTPVDLLSVSRHTMHGLHSNEQKT